MFSVRYYFLDFMIVTYVAESFMTNADGFERRLWNDLSCAPLEAWSLLAECLVLTELFFSRLSLVQLGSSFCGILNTHHPL